MAAVIRRSMKLAVAVSLGLLIGTVVLWAASYFTPVWLGYSERLAPAGDHRGVRWEVRCVRITSVRGKLALVDYQLLIDPKQPITSTWRFSTTTSDEFRRPIPTGSRDIGYLASHGWQAMGFELVTNPKIIVLPYAFLALLYSILPLAWLASRVRTRRRLARGLCPSCGYDLRATPAQCPECGALPKKDTAETS